MTDMTSAANETAPNIPANNVSRRLAKKPMTFMKALDTIDSISEYLSVVKLDYVYALVPVVGRVSVKTEP